MKELEETMAWAMREASELTHADCVPLARAALSALESAGYVVVPREATQAMIKAADFYNATLDNKSSMSPQAWVWNTMIDEALKLDS